MTDLNIEANVPWALNESVDCDYLSFSYPAEALIKWSLCTYVDNPLTTEREATLTLSATDAGATESVDIILTQEVAGLYSESLRAPLLWAKVCNSFPIQQVRPSCL